MIKHSEIIQEGNPFKPAMDGAIALEAQLKQLIETSKQMAKALLQTTQKTDPKQQAKEVDRLTEEYKKQQAALKETQKIKDQILKENAKYVASQQAEAKELARAKVENQKKNKELQQEIRLEGVAKDSLERKRAVLAKMQQRYARLSGEMRTKAIPAIKKLDTEVKRLEADMGKHQRNVGNYKSAWGGLTKVLGAFGVMVGGAAIVGFFKNSITKFGEQETAIIKVRTALLSTGQAAGLTLKQLTAEASRLQKNTIFGDETILNDATAQLLTFTNITGQNFLRTQQAALNLSTVLDGDLKSASIQLGKALNDPVANLSALSRSGIQFSKEQKAVINSLVQQNKLYEAQTIILDELDRQYGGQAEAMAGVGVGALVQFKNAWGDLMERVGGGLIKVINPVVQTLHRWVAVTEKQSSAIFKEQQELNTLVNGIIPLNEKSELRLKLIEELTKKYPGFIALLGDEGTGNDNLLSKLKDVNEQYNIRLRNMLLQEKVTENEEELAKLTGEAYEAYKKLTVLKEIGAQLDDKNSKVQVEYMGNFNKDLRKAQQNYDDLLIKIEKISRSLMTNKDAMASWIKEAGIVPEMDFTSTAPSPAEKEKEENKKRLEILNEFKNAGLKVKKEYWLLTSIGLQQELNKQKELQQKLDEERKKENEKQEQEKLKLLTDYQNEGFYITKSLQDMSLQQLKDYFEKEKELIIEQNDWKKQQAQIFADQEKVLNEISAEEDAEITTNKAALQTKLINDITNAQAEHQASVQADIDLQQKKKDATLFALDSISEASQKGTAVEKAALIAKRLMALREVAISMGIITAKSAETQAKSAAALPFPLNIPLIIGAIAQFASIFSIIKSIKFGKGGSGEMTSDGVSITSGEHKGKLLSGKTHAQGGTPVTIEAERGEYFGILNRKATAKLKPELPKIFESLNRGELPQSFGVNVMENLKVYERVNNQLDPYNEKIYNVLRKEKRQTYIQNGKMVIVNGNHKQVISI